jgi:hypothetical protein
MQRRLLLAFLLAGGPAGAALAQPAARRGARHDQVLEPDFDALPPGAKDRVVAAFRAGTPDLDEAAIRQRWNAMTPSQRGEVLARRAGRGPDERPRGSGPRRAGPPAG